MATQIKQYDRQGFHQWVADELADITEAADEFLDMHPYNLLQCPECWVDDAMNDQATYVLSRLYKESGKDTGAAIHDLHRLSFICKAQSVFVDNLLVAAMDLEEE